MQVKIASALLNWKQGRISDQSLRDTFTAAIENAITRDDRELLDLLASLLTVGQLDAMLKSEPPEAKSTNGGPGWI